MAQVTAIEWCDLSWNPVHGCSKVSPGCAHCYAETLSRRYMQTLKPWTSANAAENVILKPHKLLEPLSKGKDWREPKRVFVNSTSDLFHELVPVDYIARVFAVMAIAHQHTFQVLTKRPERMHDVLKSWSFCKAYMAAVLEIGAGRIPNSFVLADEFYDGKPLPNVWLGVSIENRRYVGRADVLRATPAAIRFISAEPLLGPLVGNVLTTVEWERALEALPLDGGLPDLGESYTDYALRTRREWAPNLNLAGIDWLIVGGESGPKHRPLREEWVRDLRDACLAQSPKYPSAVEVHMQPILAKARADGQAAEAARTAFFLKQMGGARPGTALSDLPADLQIREMPNGYA